MILRRIVNWLLHSMQRERETVEIWGHRRNLSGSGPGGPSLLLADLVRGTKSARTPAVCGKVEGPCGVAWWTAGKKWLASESAQVNASGCPNKTQIKNSCCLASGLRVCLARDLARTYPACRATFTLVFSVFSWGEWRWLCKQGSQNGHTAESFLPKSVTSCGASLVLVHLTGFCWSEKLIALSYKREGKSCPILEGFYGSYEGWNNETVLHESRPYFPETKRIIFALQYGGNDVAWKCSIGKCQGHFVQNILLLRASPLAARPFRVAGTPACRLPQGMQLPIKSKLETAQFPTTCCCDTKPDDKHVKWFLLVEIRFTKISCSKIIRKNRDGLAMVK